MYNDYIHKNIYDVILQSNLRSLSSIFKVIFSVRIHIPKWRDRQQTSHPPTPEHLYTQTRIITITELHIYLYSPLLTAGMYWLEDDVAKWLVSTCAVWIKRMNVV